jgi:hypothetical protein
MGMAMTSKGEPRPSFNLFKSNPDGQNTAITSSNALNVPIGNQPPPVTPPQPVPKDWKSQYRLGKEHVFLQQMERLKPKYTQFVPPGPYVPTQTGPYMRGSSAPVLPNAGVNIPAGFTPKPQPK